MKTELTTTEMFIAASAISEAFTAMILFAENEEQESGYVTYLSGYRDGATNVSGSILSLLFDVPKSISITALENYVMRYSSRLSRQMVIKEYCEELARLSHGQE